MQALRVLSSSCEDPKLENDDQTPADADEPLSIRRACLLNRATALINSESFAAALSDCEQVLAQHPRCAAAATRRALALEGQEQWADAEEAFRVAVDLSAKDDYALVERLSAVSARAAKAENGEVELDFDWSKYEPELSAPAADAALGKPPTAVHREMEAADSGGPDTNIALTEASEAPAEVCSLSAKLGQLAMARQPLKRREWDAAAEVLAADPASLLHARQEDEEIDGVDSMDSWAAKAYGEADFGPKDDEPPNSQGNGDRSTAHPSDNSDEDAPPGYHDNDGPLEEEEDDDGMPALENPDL